MAATVKVWAAWALLCRARAAVRRMSVAHGLITLFVLLDVAFSVFIIVCEAGTIGPLKAIQTHIVAFYLAHSSLRLPVLLFLLPSRRRVTASPSEVERRWSKPSRSTSTDFTPSQGCHSSATSTRPSHDEEEIADLARQRRLDLAEKIVYLASDSVSLAS